jgi:hypothetical protein
MDHDEPIAPPLDLMKPMGRDQYGASGITKRVEKVQKIAGTDDIERVGRLVEYERRRIMDEGSPE